MLNITLYLTNVQHVNHFKIHCLMNQLNIDIYFFPPDPDPDIFMEMQKVKNLDNHGENNAAMNMPQWIRNIVKIVHSEKMSEWGWPDNPRRLNSIS